MPVIPPGYERSPEPVEIDWHVVHCRPARSTPEVVDLVGSGSEYLQVPGGVIDTLRARVDAGTAC